jgi:3-dehydroquinate synthase
VTSVTPSRIDVAGERPYPVLIGYDLLDQLPTLVAGARQAAVLFSAPLERTARRVADLLSAAGPVVLTRQVPDAEAGKTVEVAAGCWDALGEARFTRTDVVVGVGGGAVTDLAGWVAASWLRGVRVVQIPTSLLAMVDAGVGGKTGINTAAGKNLVGAFHPPVGVLCDLEVLSSLPPAELRSGMA